jgi:hypothetical protein
MDEKLEDVLSGIIVGADKISHKKEIPEKNIEQCQISNKIIIVKSNNESGYFIYWGGQIPQYYMGKKFTFKETYNKESKKPEFQELCIYNDTEKYSHKVKMNGKY